MIEPGFAVFAYTAYLHQSANLYLLIFLAVKPLCIYHRLCLSEYIFTHIFVAALYSVFCYRFPVIYRPSWPSLGNM